MNWKEYCILMKNSGWSWFAHILPFGLLVAITMQFTSSQVKFREEMCQCSRFGNSGLFLVFSKEVQEKLYKSREETRRWQREEEEQEEKEEYERLNKKFASSEVDE